MEAQQLTALAALAEGMCSVPRTYDRQLTPPTPPVPRDLATCPGLHRKPHTGANIYAHMHMHLCAHTQMHTHTPSKI